MQIVTPTEKDAIHILQHTLGMHVQTIQRFPTGMAHYVYDVRTEDQQNIVVRLARLDLKDFFISAVY